MKIATAHLESAAPYSQSRYHDVARGQYEDFQDYEERVWREKMHVNENGLVFIPPMAFKNALTEAAKYLSVKIPGGGRTTFTKHFEAGILVPEGLALGPAAEVATPEWLFVPADGQRGGAKRVKKCFPKIVRWSGDLEIFVLDEAITCGVLRTHLDAAGKFTGIGRFRPNRNGYYGRFVVKSLEWSDG